MEHPRSAGKATATVLSVWGRAAGWGTDLQHSDILPWAGCVASGDAELCFGASWRKGRGSRCWVVLLMIYIPFGCATAWPPALLSSSSSCDFVFQVSGDSKLQNPQVVQLGCALCPSG